MNYNNMFLSGMFIIPYDYPNKYNYPNTSPSKIKIFDLYSKKEK